MSIRQSHYETLLAAYSNHAGAIALFKKYRPYLEMIPSMRRPKESVIPIPLPLVRTRNAVPASGTTGTTIAPGDVIRLPCDVAVLMCDPEWKVKTGVEVFIFIHRPYEDFSDLLARWRQTQIWLDKEYEWLMPSRYKHILSEGTDDTRPLFVLFPDTPERIRQGLRGACLPYVIQTVQTPEDDLDEEPVSTPETVMPELDSQ
ncbi:MAG: hypothetical protein WBA43_12590 [Elainellaceae cyanobacterium]